MIIIDKAAGNVKARQHVSLRGFWTDRDSCSIRESYRSFSAYAKDDSPAYAFEISIRAPSFRPSKLTGPLRMPTACSHSASLVI